MTTEPAKAETDPQKTSEHEEVKKTFEIPAPKVEVPKLKMTEQEAVDAGWSEEEMSIGRDTKIFTEPKKEGDEGDKNKEESGKKVESPAAEVKKDEPVDKVDKAEDFLLTPEDEEKLSEAVKDPNATKKLKNVAAQYFGRKSAISRAQYAEGERDRVIDEMKEIKEQNRQLLDKISAKPDSVEDDEEDDKPLTRKQFRELQTKQKEDELHARDKQDEQTQAQADKIHKALKRQEEKANLEFSDFKEVVKFGETLIKRDQTGKFVSEVNLSNIPENAQKKAFAILRRIKAMMVRADEIGPDDINVADMSYDLGILAREFVKPKSKDSQEPKAERNDGGLTPEEQAEREKKNKNRGGSSASITGTGGRKILSVDEVTLDDLNAMPSTVFDQFERQHPDKVDELMRG